MNVPTIQIIEKTPEDQAAIDKVFPVALAVRCLTCRWVGPGHRVFTVIWSDARRHYRVDHPGMWEEGGNLYERVALNVHGEVVG